MTTPKGFLMAQLMSLGASYERAENEWHRLEAFCVREIADQEGSPYAALVFDGVGGDVMGVDLLSEDPE